MSLTVAISLGQLAREVAARYRTAPARCLRALVAGMHEGVAIVHGRIVAERFTGQGPFAVGEHRLGVKTGRLRQSLTFTPPTVSGSTVTAKIGSNVKYLGPHEFGFRGSVTVKAHQRRTSANDRFLTRGGGTVTRRAALAGGLLTKKGEGRSGRAAQVSSGIANVKSFSRTMNVPERAMLRTGIREHAAKELGISLRAAMRKEFPS